MSTDSAPEQRRATRFSSSSRREERISRAPHCAKRRASASPIPLDAPVTQTTFPRKTVSLTDIYKNLQNTKALEVTPPSDHRISSTGGPYVRSLVIAGLILANVVVFAQTQRPAGVIQGIVQSGNVPIPGVTVTAINFITDEKVTTSTDLNGQYQLKVPATGAYIVETSMAAFAQGVKEANVKDANQPERVDLELVLLSLSQQASTPVRRRVGVRGQAAQRIAPTQAESEARAQEATNANDTAEQNASGELPIAEFPPDAPTESVAVLGNTGQTTFGNNFDFDRDRIQQFIDERFGAPGGGQEGGGDNFNIPGAPGPAGPGGRGGGGRGGGGGGGRGGGFAFGRGGFNVNRPRGNISYTLGDSAFDAAPYSLTGQPTIKPSYNQNRF